MLVRNDVRLVSAGSLVHLAHRKPDMYILFVAATMRSPNHTPRSSAHGSGVTVPSASASSTDRLRWAAAPDRTTWSDSPRHTQAPRMRAHLATEPHRRAPSARRHASRRRPEDVARSTPAGSDPVMGDRHAERWTGARRKRSHSRREVRDVDVDDRGSISWALAAEASLGQSAHSPVDRCRTTAALMAASSAAPSWFHLV